MSQASIAQTPSTSDLIAAATLAADDYLARNPGPVAADDTGERYIPLVTLDMLLTCRDGVRWKIALFAPAKTGKGMVEIAVVTNHDGARLLPPHLALVDVAYASRLPVATEELRWIVEASQEGRAAA